MTEGHTFIDRKGEIDTGKDTMVQGRISTFQSYPDYRHSFHRVQSGGSLVTPYGYATWEQGIDPDYAIWTAVIEDDRVVEWRIYADTEQNRRRFNLF